MLFVCQFGQLVASGRVKVLCTVAPSLYLAVFGLFASADDIIRNSKVQIFLIGKVEVLDCGTEKIEPRGGMKP